MIDIKMLRENPDVFRESIKNRHMEKVANVDTVLELDQKYNDQLRLVETKRALKNQLSSDISKVTADEREKLVTEATQVKNDLVKLEEELKELDLQLNLELKKIPNLISPQVPFGLNEDENVVAEKWGEPTNFDFEPKDHVELGELLDVIDIETAAKVTGARFYYLKNEAVLLQFALIQYVFETLGNKQIVGEIAKQVGNPHDTPFVPVLPPVILKSEVSKKMDRFDPIEDRYYLEKDDQLLVGSAEHTLGPVFMDQILKEEDLPIRFIGYSTAFRREAGSYGKDTRGILRTHQFDKMEMESFATVENGQKEQDLIVGLQRYMVEQLEIPHQVIHICTGDMGKPDFRQVDIECWIPTQGKYRETHTSDYMTDFQARRLNTRYKTSAGDTKYVHMNDATAFAIGRILIAILENNQQKDGSVKVPTVLQKYMNGIEKISIK